MKLVQLMKPQQQLQLALWVILLGSKFGFAADSLVHFEELPLDGAKHYNGSDFAGPFSSRGTTFANNYFDDGQYTYWDGWAYSRETDTTTPDFENQYSAYPGSGASDSGKYVIGFTGSETSVITLPASAIASSVRVANSTYAALIMLDGDINNFAKQFGGPTGDDPDWFLLTIIGEDSTGADLAQEEHYLADYRYSNSSEDFVQDDWQEIDLTSLAGATQLRFQLTSSDVGMFGMNTPAYFALDDLLLTSTADFNDDLLTDDADLTAWQTHFGVANALPTQGDANNDGLNNGTDLLFWQQQFNPGAVGESAANATNVPEPTTFVLFAASSCTMLCVREPRRRL